MHLSDLRDLYMDRVMVYRHVALTDDMIWVSRGLESRVLSFI